MLAPSPPTEAAPVSRCAQPSLASFFPRKNKNNREVVFGAATIHTPAATNVQGWSRQRGQGGMNVVGYGSHAATPSLPHTQSPTLSPCLPLLLLLLLVMLLPPLLLLPPSLSWLFLGRSPRHQCHHHSRHYLSAAATATVIASNISVISCLPSVGRVS